MMQKSVLREYQKLSAVDQVEMASLMQEKHDRDLQESVMLGLAFQTSWVMENLQHKSCILPDPDIFTFDNVFWLRVAAPGGRTRHYLQVIKVKKAPTPYRKRKTREFVMLYLSTQIDWYC